MVLTGVVSKVIFTAPKGFAIFLLRVEGKDKKCAGVVHDLHPGVWLTLDGADENSSYGKQFKVKDYQVILPKDKSSIVAFLSSGLIEGVGEKTAKRMVDIHGEKIYEILDTFPEELLKIPGVSKGKLDKIIRSWRENKHLRKLDNLLGSGVSRLTIKKIYEKYGEKSILTLQENPYVLVTDVEGFGFLKSDNIAINRLGFSKEDPKRIDAAIQHTLMEVAEKRGDVYLTAKDLISESSKLLDFKNPDIVIDRLNSLLDDNNPNLTTRNVNGEKVFYFKQYFDFENYIAKRVNELKAGRTSYNYLPHLGNVLDSRKAQGIQLSMDQLQAVDLIMNHSFCCLNGEPGVGKTTIIKVLLDTFKALGLSVDLIAPTGRASQRMTEATGQRASTIHRYLSANGQFSGGFKVPSNVVIIDECSMVDLKLFHMFIKGVSPSVHVIFVGDYNQLPPVGVGDIFRNLVQEESIPTARLTTVFRQGKDSGILKFIHSITRSKTPVITRAVSKEDMESDCLLLDYKNEETRLPKLVSLYKSLIDKDEEVQIITCKREGALGVNSINETLQRELNPATGDKNEIQIGHRILREGDKVLQTKNDYELDVFNGEIGVVKSIDSDEKLIEVEFPDRDIVFSLEKAQDLELAYAITVHKSQGSEFRNVIFALYCDAYYMLSLNILMTGASRAKKRLFIQGEYKAIAICMSKGSQSIRKSYIPELIKSSCGHEDQEAV